ncbi:MAG TPA: inositol monophosphatase family protein [Bryobacteraceae bacterium]|nr:inositol monophosphatase family protein [Bryobacteraceae bacterium]
MTEAFLKEILDFALELNAAAGEFILPLWKNVRVDHKSDGSEVTEADRGAEQLLRRLLAARYPDHAILGEEFGGERNPQAEHLWLLDPVDGTASFAAALPLFGTLIACLHRGEPVVGLIGAHALGETTYAAKGLGCWHRENGKPPVRVRTSATTELNDAYVIATGVECTDLDPLGRRPDLRVSELYRRAKRFRWSGDCINYSLLCQGRIDVALDPRMNPWDIAALVPCVKEAGGVLTALDGNEDVVWGSDLVASATPQLHAHVLETLAVARRQSASDRR